MMVFLSM